MCAGNVCYAPLFSPLFSPLLCSPPPSSPLMSPLSRFSLSDSSSLASSQLPKQESATMHGFAGYFDSMLFDDVHISINPKTHTPGMFSWFPLYFPLRVSLWTEKRSRNTGGEEREKRRMRWLAAKRDRRKKCNFPKATWEKKRRRKKRSTALASLLYFTVISFPVVFIYFYCCL